MSRTISPPDDWDQDELERVSAALAHTHWQAQRVKSAEEPGLLAGAGNWLGKQWADPNVRSTLTAGALGATALGGLGLATNLASGGRRKKPFSSALTGAALGGLLGAGGYSLYNYAGGNQKVLDAQKLLSGVGGEAVAAKPPQVTTTPGDPGNSYALLQKTWKNNPEDPMNDTIANDIEAARVAANKPVPPKGLPTAQRYLALKKLIEGEAGPGAGSTLAGTTFDAVDKAKDLLTDPGKPGVNAPVAGAAAGLAGTAFLDTYGSIGNRANLPQNPVVARKVLNENADLAQALPGTASEQDRHVRRISGLSSQEQDALAAGRGPAELPHLSGHEPLPTPPPLVPGPRPLAPAPFSAPAPVAPGPGARAKAVADYNNALTAWNELRTTHAQQTASHASELAKYHHDTSRAQADADAAHLKAVAERTLNARKLISNIQTRTQAQAAKSYAEPAGFGGLGLTRYGQPGGPLPTGRKGYYGIGVGAGLGAGLLQAFWAESARRAKELDLEQKAYTFRHHPAGAGQQP